MGSSHTTHTTVYPGISKEEVKRLRKKYKDIIDILAKFNFFILTKLDIREISVKSLFPNKLRFSIFINPLI
jgi:hypothetical protein